MKSAEDPLTQRDQTIAALLWSGTWFASALIAAGILVTAFQPFLPPVEMPLSGRPFSGRDLTAAGIATFILLPVARVALMLILFLRERDYLYTLIAAIVLAIISAGVLIDI